MKKSNNYKSKKRYFNLIIISLLILMGFFYSIAFKSELNILKSSSSRSYISDTEFNLGTFDNISITPDGNIILTEEIKYVEDDFFDLTKINYMENITINTTSGEALLIKKESPVVEEWNLSYGGTSHDSGNFIQPTKDGGYLVIGTTMSYGANPGFHDIWIIKIDGTGKKQWSRTIGGIDSDWMKSAQQTIDDGYIITGMTSSYSSGKRDIWLIKVDSSGKELWNRTFGGANYEDGYSIQETSDNGFIITGYTGSYGLGNADIWLVKTDSSGSEQWNKTIGGSSWEEGHSVLQTSDDGFFITGYTRSFSTGYAEAWLIKTDKYGNEQWNKTYNAYTGNSILKTSDGGYLITGETFSPGPGNYDMWLLKTDDSGNTEWEKTFGGPKREEGNMVIHSSDGGYIILGYTTSYGAGGYDIWMVKTDTFGNEKWNRTFGGINDDSGLFITEIAKNKYMIAGYTSSFAAAGETDLWLIKTYKSEYSESEGILISENLLEKLNSSSINIFEYSTYIPSNTNIEIQFSLDNLTWCDSSGTINDWDELKHGSKTILLKSLDWSGPNFYYRAKFFALGRNIPIIRNLNISFYQHFSSGTYTSEAIDLDEDVKLKSILTNSTEPPGTEVQIQIKIAQSKDNLSIREFIGPNGTSGSYYTGPQSKVWSENPTGSWLQYKVHLSTMDTSYSPILSNVTIIYNCLPKLISPAVTPNTGNTSVEFNFSVFYRDGDNDPPHFIRVCIDGENYSLIESESKNDNFIDGKIFWFTMKLYLGNHSIQFIASDSEAICSTEKFNLNVSVGPLNKIFINPYFITIKVDTYQTFIASGYDYDNNKIPISPKWDITGGGIIDQSGNFIATTPGSWIIFANSSGITGKAAVEILPKDNGNGHKPDPTKNGDKDKDTSEMTEENMVLQIGIFILSVIIIILIIYISLKKKSKSMGKPKSGNELKYEEKRNL